MANRRMFSPDIVDSDAFLDMGHGSQVLYFHLAMRADDDGFVNPKKVMRVIGSSEDDLKVLLAKRFLLIFKSGVVVIKHWLIHNLIRHDRYKETMYLEEKRTLATKENKAYTELATTGQPNGNQMATQVRLGKVRLGQDTHSVGFDEFYAAYPKKVGKPAALKAWLKEKPDPRAALDGIASWRESDSWSRDGGRYIPNPATFINQRRWEDEVESSSPQTVDLRGF